MMRTFNCGIGAVLICDEIHYASLMKILASSGEEFWPIGRVDHYQMSEPRVAIHHLDEVLCPRKNDTGTLLYNYYI